MPSELDEIFLKGRGKLAPPAEPDALESALKEQGKILADELRTTQAQEIITNRRKSIAMTEKEIDAIRGKNSGAAVDAVSTQVSAESSAALLNALIKSGTDPEKANEVLKKLDQEVLAKLVVMSGSNAGSNSLVPLLLLARQPTTSVMDVVQAAKSISEMVPKPEKPNNPTILELTEALKNLKELAPEQDTGVGEALQELKAGQDALKDKMHQQEIAHQKEMAEAEKARLTAEIGSVRQELAALKGRNLRTEVQEAKEFMESLGFKIQVGGAERGPDLEKITETIINSPAIKGMADAAGDAIRARATHRGFQGPSGPADNKESFACSTCANRGVRTILPITPEAASGQVPITCPVCGTVYEKKR